QLSRRRAQPAAAVEGVGIARIEPDRLAVILHRSIVVALGLVSDAAAVEGIGVVRIKADRPVVILDRAVGVALGDIGSAAILEGNGETLFRQTSQLNAARAAVDANIE